MAVLRGAVVLITIFIGILLFHTQISPCDGGSYTPLKIDIPDEDSIRIFSDEDLKKYDGSNPELPIYMGIKGVVFDVTSGEKFYGKNAAYNALVGKDSTCAVAKMSLDPSDLHSNIGELTDEQLKSLDKIFTGTYKPKYPIVGYMDYLVMNKQDFGIKGTEDRANAKEDL